MYKSAFSVNRNLIQSNLS